MTRTEATIRHRVRGLEEKHHPGTNPLLTRDMWDDMVRAAGYNVLALRVDTADAEAEEQSRDLAKTVEPRMVDATEVVRAVEEELCRSYPGLPSLRASSGTA